MLFIDWELFPEKKPAVEFRPYLVTGINDENEKIVDIGYYVNGHFYDENDKRLSVVRWVEVPFPYDGNLQD